MKEKELRSVAQALADMATSSKVSGKLGELVDSESGSLSIDLLSTSSRGGELRLWWGEQTSKFPKARIVKAIVNIEYDATGVPTNKNKLALFDLVSECIISTERKTYVANSQNKVWWQANA